MSGTLSFKDKVVVVTGAGVGLGKAYALFYASRGAKVVVNDLGTSHTGSGSSSKNADLVVEEIKRNGGEAVANYDSVEFGDKVIGTALDTYGRIDILINNAGILRDTSFKKMQPQDWDLIVKVHLNGVYSCSKAAFTKMLNQKYGRIITVSSPAGLYGAFGQVNYSTAKSGMVGFTQSLAKEGEKYNIHTNCIAPIAATRMTETVMSPELLENLKVDYIVPVVAWLTHDECEENGSIYEVGGRWTARLRWQRSEGVEFIKSMTPEDVKKQWETVNDFSRNNSNPVDSNSGIEIMLNLADKMKNKTSAVSAESDKVFALIKAYLTTDEGKALQKKVNATFGFDILEKKGGKLLKSWTIDLKKDVGVREGSEKADSTFTVGDSDFVSITEGKLNPQKAFIQGIMKIKGSMALATKFTPELFPKPTPENIAKYSAAKF